MPKQGDQTGAIVYTSVVSSVYLGLKRRLSYFSSGGMLKTPPSNTTPVVFIPNIKLVSPGAVNMHAKTRRPNGAIVYTSMETQACLHQASVFVDLR